MITLAKSISRRTFVKGAGTAISLPLLGATLASAAATAAAAATKRVGFVYVPHGMVMTDTVDWWTPPTVGANFEFSRTLKPLEPFRDAVTVVSNLSGMEGAGQHAGAASAWLTDSRPKMTDTPQVEAGTSIDQVIATHYAGSTPIPSMQAAVEDLGGLVGLWHTGYSCRYLNSLSWSSPTAPLAAELKPRVVFEKMFAAGATPEQVERRVVSRRSILDSVLEDTRRVQRRLSAADSARLDQYFANIREVEKRIVQAEAVAPATADASRAKVPIPYADHVELMFDLLHLAYQADVTRVFTFMMAREISQLKYPQIGVNESHHALSHHQSAPEAMRMLGDINRYHVALFSKFVGKLASTPEGEGSLLDHTLLVYGSGMSNGNDHDKSRLPTVLVGGLVKGNRHIALSRPAPMGDLHLAVAHQLGVPLGGFGQRSTGAVSLS